jgi:hypothetical protein
VGKFRKSQNYNDDYNYDSKKKTRNEYSEIKKLKNMKFDIDLLNEFEEKASLPKVNYNK